MTLVEVIVAGVILMVTMIPMGVLLANATSAAAQSRQREAAVQLADSWVEILSNVQPQEQGGPCSPARSRRPRRRARRHPRRPWPARPIPSPRYYEAVAVNNRAGTDLCASGEPPSPSHPDVFELTVRVEWDGKYFVSDSTEINYPKPGLQTDGFLAVNVTNDGETDANQNTAATRLQNVLVTISSSSLTLNDLTADPNGCIFVQVPPDTYTVTEVAPPTGTLNGWGGYPQFVTESGNTSVTASSQPVTVTAEQSVQLDAFDEGIVGNITYGGSAAVDSGVECPGTPSVTCISTGSGTSGGSDAWGGAGSTWSDATLAAGDHVNQVDCNGWSYCVGVGYGSTGGLILASASGFGSPSADTVPAGVTDIAQVTCPSASGCYALGVTATGPALLAGRVGPGPDVWTNVTPGGITFSSLDSIACPSSTTCEVTYSTTWGTPGVLRLDGDPAPSPSTRPGPRPSPRTPCPAPWSRSAPSSAPPRPSAKPSPPATWRARSTPP